MPVGSGDTFETNCKDWAFVQHHSLNQSFIMCDNVLYKVFITICMVNKLFIDINMIFFSDLHSAVAAQICLQNDASPIFQ
jgi:hypothetical protein